LFTDVPANISLPTSGNRLFPRAFIEPTDAISYYYCYFTTGMQCRASNLSFELGAEVCGSAVSLPSAVWGEFLLSFKHYYKTTFFV